MSSGRAGSFELSTSLVCRIAASERGVATKEELSIDGCGWNARRVLSQQDPRTISAARAIPGIEETCFEMASLKRNFCLFTGFSNGQALSFERSQVPHPDEVCGSCASHSGARSLVFTAFKTVRKVIIAALCE